MGPLNLILLTSPRRKSPAWAGKTAVLIVMRWVWEMTLSVVTRLADKEIKGLGKGMGEGGDAVQVIMIDFK